MTGLAGQGHYSVRVLDPRRLGFLLLIPTALICWSIFGHLSSVEAITFSAGMGVLYLVVPLPKWKESRKRMWITVALIAAECALFVAVAEVIHALAR